MLSGLSTQYKNMFKDVAPKEGKHLKETADDEQFYKTMGGVFYVPPIAYLKNNLSELMTLQEVFESYYNSENVTPEEWDLNNVNKKLYSSTRDIIKLIRFLDKQEEIAVDIETTGFSFFDDELLLVVLCWGPNDVAVIDNFSPAVISYLQALFNNKDITFIWQNGKFDISRLKAFSNLDTRIDEDTMLMHYIGFNENRGTHGLGYLAMLHLQAPDWEKDLDKVKRQEVRRRKIKLADFNYGMFPKEVLVHYGYYDGLATFRLYKFFKEQFPKEREFIYRKLVEASNYLADIELKGVYADQEMISKLDKELTIEYGELLRELDDFTRELWDIEAYKRDTGAKSASEQFNPSSPQQLKWILEQIGHNVDDTSEKTIQKIDSEFTRTLLKLRRNNKYRRTYVNGLRESIDLDGRIHTNYNLHGTVTGRLSSSNPNLQNIPRDKTIKNIFRATPGYVFTQADYSQAELRVLAVLADDPWLQNVYKEGKDLHSEIAIQFYGEDFTSEDRVKAKMVNFGIAYGSGANTMSENLGIPKHEAQRLLDDWYRPMPNVRKYFDEKIKTAFQEKISTTPFGRRRNFILTTKNKFAVRNEAMNTTIQGTASDLTLFSLVEIQKELTERNLGSVVLTVHDSVIAENLPEHTEAVAEVMVRHMREVPKKYLKTDVPFEADIDIGELWGEMG